MHHFTCKYGTGLTVEEEVANLTNDRTIISYNPGKGDVEESDVVIGFATWEDMVAFTADYVNDGPGSPTNSDNKAERDTHLYGYLLKYARSPQGGW